MDLKVGDVVKLKTGGPKMTVQRLGVGGYGVGTNMLEAVWFQNRKLADGTVEYGNLNCADFAPEILEKVGEEESETARAIRAA